MFEEDEDLHALEENEKGLREIAQRLKVKVLVCAASIPGVCFLRSLFPSALPSWWLFCIAIHVALCFLFLVFFFLFYVGRVKYRAR